MSQADVDNFQAMECTGFHYALGERCHLQEGHKGYCAGSYGVTWVKRTEDVKWRNPFSTLVDRQLHERALRNTANREDQKVKDYMDSTAPSFEQQILPGEAGKLLERIHKARRAESERNMKLARLEMLLMTDHLIREFLQLRAEVGL